MTEGEENIIIKGVLLEAISRDFSEELSNNKEVSVLKAERGCFYEEENYTAILSGAVAGDCHDSDLCCN